MADIGTTLYYTFSTISQTLAGALGLVAAFAAMRLASLNAAVERLLHRLKQTLRDVEMPKDLKKKVLAETLRGEVNDQRQLFCPVDDNDSVRFRPVSIRRVGDFERRGVSG